MELIKSAAAMKTMAETALWVEIKETIEYAAEQGLTECDAPIGFNEEHRKKLETLGYKIRQAGFSVSKDLIISWG